MRRLLEELFSTYYKDIYRYLYSLSRDAELSEDLTQEVFLEVVKSIAAFRGESDIKTWMFSIARHKWYGYLKKKKRQAPTELLSEFFEETGKSMENIGKSVEETVDEQELIARIYELLEEEPERTRQIVKLRLEGFSFYEIGQKLGISESSARVIDFRAKARIRAKLEKEDGI